MDSLKNKIDKILDLPRRKEYLGGQETSYVQLDNVLAILEETPKLEHEWEFCMNGSFCKRCGAQIGSGVSCAR